MSAETCPRCRHRNGYPIPWTIKRGDKMVFSCRDCGHRWVKRKASGGTFGKWYVYGFGFLIGIVFAVYEFFGDTIQSIINWIKGLFG